LSCKYPDEFLRKKVEDRIQKPFIGTLEDDLIIQTIFELEQFIGKEIHWVSGLTYNELVQKGYLPNKMKRFCTTFLKIDPIFYWWAEMIGEPIEMQLGFRANEMSRANRMLEKVNENGLLEYKATFEKTKGVKTNGRKSNGRLHVFHLLRIEYLRPTLKNIGQISQYHLQGSTTASDASIETQYF